jgi:hypothetical protein
MSEVFSFGTFVFWILCGSGVLPADLGVDVLECVHGEHKKCDAQHQAET